MPGDLDVDVLVVGGGVMGHYLAAQLADRYTVCLLTDPSARVETLDAEGLLSAGYDGNDVGRVQPARRAAGYWRLWAESHGLDHDEAPSIILVPPDDETRRVRSWSDAALHSEKLDSVPEIFEDGTVSDHVAFRAGDDVVLDPAVMLAELRSGIEDCCIEGEVIDMTLANDETVDAVDVLIDGEMVPIAARATVFAASGGNAGLLAKLAARTHDATTRRERAEAARTSQAVRKRLQLFIRGAALPMVTAEIDDIHVVAHRVDDEEVAWVCYPPIDDALTTLGPEDQRFDPPTDRDQVASLVGKLFSAAPRLRDSAPELEWMARVRRKTEHPMMAGPDVSEVGQPSPARIETFGMDAFWAIWPGHAAFAMVVGDVIAERIAERLGEPSGADPAEVAEMATEPPALRATFASSDRKWLGWSEFCDRFGIEP